MSLLQRMNDHHRTIRRTWLSFPLGRDGKRALRLAWRILGHPVGRLNLLSDVLLDRGSHELPRAMHGAAVALVALAALGLVSCNSAQRWTTLDGPWQQRLDVEASRAQRGGSDRSAFGPSDARDAEPAHDSAPDWQQALLSELETDDDAALEISIEEATLLAISQNRDLRVQQFAPVIAGAFERIERGVFDPELFADLAYSEESANETSRATGGQFAVEGEQLQVGAGVRQTLPTGTTVSLGATEDRAYSSRSPDQHQSRLGLTVTQALLEGFGPAVNLASVRQAELDTIASLYELRGFTESLVAQTEQAYWRFVLAREQIAIFQRSLELAQQQRNDVDQRIEVGVLPRTEAAAARAEVALREQALIDARTELQVARLQLLRRMNVEPLASLTRPVEPTTVASIAPIPEDGVAERVQLAQVQRPEINEARLQLEQRRLETVVTRNGLLPRLDFFLTLGKSGYAGAFDEAIRNISDQSYDLNAGLEFSLPLGNNVDEGLHKVAVASRQQAAAAIENLEQLIALEVRLAWTELERARQQIDATAATSRLREETLRAEEERFGVGSSTSLLVAQAQRDLLESQIAQVEAVVEYRIALIDLYLAEGSLLERRGLVLERPH